MTTTLAAEECTDDLNNMERLIDAEDAVLSIAKFLSAKDCLSLHAVSRGFHAVVSKHDQALFENHLRHDFPEGRVLLYVAKKKNLSHKKLYRAFLGRWSLPKQADEKIRAASEDYEGDRNTKIMITWVQPPDIPDIQYEGAKVLIPNDDVDNLVFIVRVGAGDADSCALMEWNSEHDPKKSAHRSQLIIDKSWCDHNGGEGLHLPQDGEAEKWMYGEMNVGQLTEALKSKHSLTLHAIDIRYYQVASLLENYPLEDYVMYNKNNDRVSKFTSFYGFGLPTLWGVSPKFSPFHRELTEKDFKYFLWYGFEDEDEDPPPLEYLPIRGKLQFNCNEGVSLDGEGEEVFDLDLYHPRKGLNFTFLGDEGESSVRKPHQICNFLRALMKEKCLEVEPRDIMQFAVVAQQPDWVQTDKVLDTITSYASFEDQAGKLRLVCRQFDASALRQIEAKLDKTKVIGFTRNQGEGGGESWFKATVRCGWSDNCLTSKESAIDDALWLASCRCCFDYCGDKDSCKNASKPLTCHGYSSDDKTSETQTVDVGILRQTLADKGRARLTEESPHDSWARQNSDYWKPSNVVECSFKEDEMTLFELCHIAGKVVDSKTGGRYEYEETGRRGRLNWHLKRDYGVSKSISSRQFVRSIFLIFVRAASKTALDKGKSSAVKKARISPYRKVTTGMAKSHIVVKGGSYSRMKRIIRFYSAENEPMEICFESRSSYVYY